ncbi:hypothetical protein ACFWIJ_34200 [Streptomyces sp. NPDC127079]|uniref:hypothetical protein n=1 Tax=Streptomyces sp. NPDC127079 TaxID=3347132 RepID=UPI00365816FA
MLCRALDRWIAEAFAPDRLAATLTALAHASAAANAAETLTPEQTQARKMVKECERRLARYQAALEAGADPAVVTQWINEAQADKEAARKKLGTPPAATRKKETPLSADQIREITERLGDIAQRVQAVDAEKKSPLDEAIGITISYEKAGRTATVRSGPSSAYRYSECPRSELNHKPTQSYCGPIFNSSRVVGEATERMRPPSPHRRIDQNHPSRTTGLTRLAGRHEGPTAAATADLARSTTAS